MIEKKIQQKQSYVLLRVACQKLNDSFRKPTTRNSGKLERRLGLVQKNVGNLIMTCFMIEKKYNENSRMSYYALLVRS